MLERIFVLMLENRSFDHMLGFSDISGWDRAKNVVRPVDGVDVLRDFNRLNPRDSSSKKIHVKRGGSDQLGSREKDPGHEFEHTLTDLCGPTATYTPGGQYPAISNSGFVYKYHQQGSVAPEKVMEVFDPAEVPNLSFLAKTYTVCDRWYSSMPGPTWPNRFFVHAGTSGGLDNSPSPLSVLGAELFAGYEFTNGTIYDRLDEKKIDWVIYEGDAFPQSFAIKGMNAQWMKGRFRDFKFFREDVGSQRFKPQYVFIEPDYGRIILPPGDFRGGNSQHPLDSVRSGDTLIGEVFEAISSSPHWDKSALIITHDEHGGFFDHVTPGPALATGDDTRYSLNGFTFEQYGVRVPTVIASPLIRRQMVDGTVYDHTSILRTVERCFDLSPLTARDEHANDFLALFSPEPSLLTRQPLPTMVHHEIAPLPEESSAPLAEEANRELDPRMRGFVHVALLRDLALREGAPALERDLVGAQTQDIRTLGQAASYLERVERRVRAFKADTQQSGQMDREAMPL